MKRVIASLGLLLLCSTAAFAGTVKAVPAPPDLAAFLSSLRVEGSSPIPIQTAARKGLRSITAQDVTCTASCGTFGTVSCTTVGTCTAVDRNCSASQPGYVDCNGTTTFCPPCGCVEGSIMYEDGGCCSGGRQKTITNKCIDGSWERIGSSCSGNCN